MSLDVQNIKSVNGRALNFHNNNDNTDEDFNRNVYVIQQCLFLYFIFCLALKDGLVRFNNDNNNK